MQRDELFRDELVKKFEFDSNVVGVFDDMISRSVPYYEENKRIISSMIRLMYKEGLVYDLGASTGNMLFEIEKSQPSLRMVGVDSSADMVKKAKKTAKKNNSNILFMEGDILDFEYEKAEAFISNYTFQFLRPTKRDYLVNKIYDSLNENGSFFISEKIMSENRVLDKTYIDIYHKFKENNGYTKTEISKKRESLENVLVPYTLEENIDMLKNAGFKTVEIVFKWANFVTLIAQKKGS